MPANLPYFDTSYLVRLYLRDHGFERVRELTAPATAIASAWHAQAEIVAAALHLACAVENGFTEVHSNDRHFLAAAPLFGLRGVNVIP